jgi:hypothetical protein
MDDEDRLPWLEAVEEDDRSPLISTTKMAVGAVIILAGLGALAATSFYFGREAGPNGQPELIAAPSAPYKVRPDDPGGLDLSEDSGTAYATSAGEDPDARLDTEAMEEETPRIEVSEPEPAPEPTPEPETPAPQPASGGQLIQLGAYSTVALAEKGWAVGWLSRSGRVGEGHRARDRERTAALSPPRAGSRPGPGTIRLRSA